MAFFDTIPHDQLMRSVARRIVDKGILKLIKARSGRRGSGMKGHTIIWTVAQCGRHTEALEGGTKPGELTLRGCRPGAPDRKPVSARRRPASIG